MVGEPQDILRPVEESNFVDTIKRSLELGYSKSVLASLEYKLAGLMNKDADGLSEEERRAREQTKVVALAVVSYESAMRDHDKFLGAGGFSRKEDFFTFGRNLENDEYWQYLQDNPDESKKVAEKFMSNLEEKVNNKEMTELEANKAMEGERVQEWLRDNGFSARMNQWGLNNDVEEMKSFAKSLDNEEGVNNLLDKNLKVEAAIMDDSVSAIEDMSNRAERKEDRIAVRDKAVAKADEAGVDNKYAKNSDSTIGAWFDTEEFQTAKNTLQESQKQVQDNPASAATDIQIAKSNLGTSEGRA